MPRLASASHILVRSASEAQSIKAKLVKGANFTQLAKRHSTCPSAKKGGDLGELQKGQMVKQFDQAVFANGSEDKPFLGPIKTKFGYHLIQVFYKD
jgi:peptidyl-prolyl cis-trans isomerase C